MAPKPEIFVVVGPRQIDLKKTLRKLRVKYRTKKMPAPNPCVPLSNDIVYIPMTFYEHPALDQLTQKLQEVELVWVFYGTVEEIDQATATNPQHRRLDLFFSALFSLPDTEDDQTPDFTKGFVDPEPAITDADLGF